MRGALTVCEGRERAQVAAEAVVDLQPERSIGRVAIGPAITRMAVEQHFEVCGPTEALIEIEAQAFILDRLAARGRGRR